MSKVIQIRNVADEVHAGLVQGAQSAGKSLNAYLVEQLESLVRRLESVEHNRRIFEESRAEFASLDISREETRRVIDDARAERDRELDERIARDRPA